MGRGNLMEVRDGSGDPPKGMGLTRGPPGGLERGEGPSRRSGTGREDLQEGPPTRPRLSGGPIVPFRTTWRAPRTVTDHPEDLSTHLGPSGGFTDPFLTSQSASRPIPNLRKGLRTCPAPLGWSLDPSRTFGWVP